jgi:SAM-dependent methyltransferase
VTNTATENFFDEWTIYEQILARNYMHHDDIFRDVEHFLADRYGNSSFSLLDLGCGSARHVALALQGRSVSLYVGYDLSDVALAHAARNLAVPKFPVDLFRGDLLDGVRTGGETFDVIFSSFALHHLSSVQKAEFFQSAHERLDEGGVLLLIDTMRDDGEERANYLDRYCSWLPGAKLCRRRRWTFSASTSGIMTFQRPLWTSARWQAKLVSASPSS